MSPCIHEIAPDFFFIQRGWLNGNHFALKGSRTVLIDTGYLEGLEETIDLLAQVGVSPEAVDLILTTHVHCDHVGAHAHIQELSGCEIALHELARHIIDQRDGWAAWPYYYGQAYRFFPTHQSLHDGDMLEFDELTLKALHTPGHAIGHLSFYLPENGWLISADAAWDGDFGVLTTGVEGWDAPFRMRDSLDRLAGLKVSRIFPGHGPPIEDGPAAIARCQERIKAYLAEPRRIAEDQMRKILIYNLMMKGPLSREAFWDFAKGLPWFNDVCQRHFPGPHEITFHKFLDELWEKGLVKEENGLLSPNLPA